jgi:hypothetical protein
MSDTGNEHPHTYVQVRHIERVCREMKIQFRLVTPAQGFHTPGWPDLKTQWRRTRTVGMKAGKKSCTDRLKITPLYGYLNAFVADRYRIPRRGRRFQGKHALVQFALEHGRIRMLIGIAKGEERRLLKPFEEPLWMRLAIERRYPLVELGVDRAGCQGYIRSVAQLVPYPSNCMLCPYLSEIELLWLATFYPAEFLEWTELEAAKLAKFAHKGKQNFTVFGRRTLLEVYRDAKRKYGHMTPQELDHYKMTHGHCVASRY